MNVLLAAGPESTTLFTITVQGSGGSPGRFVGRRHVTAPLHRLQATRRRLLLAGDTILSVTCCQPIADPPPPPHLHSAPAPVPAPESSDITESPAPASAPAPVALASAPPAEDMAPPPQQVEQVFTPAHPAHPAQTTGEGERDPVGEDMIILMLSVFGGLTLLTLQVMNRLGQQWETYAQARQRSDPPAATGVWPRDLASLRLGQLLRRARRRASTS